MICTNHLFLVAIKANQIFTVLIHCIIMAQKSTEHLALWPGLKSGDLGETRSKVIFAAVF